MDTSQSRLPRRPCQRRVSSYRSLRSLAALGAVAVVALALAGTAFARPGIFRTGVVDPQSLGGYVGAEFSWLEPGIAYSKTDSVGARLVRIPVYWYRVSPSTRPGNVANPGAYNWTDFGTDAAIRGALQQGLTPLVQVFVAPSWAECNGQGFLACPDHPSRDRGVFKVSPVDLGNFMRALSTEYPQLQYFEVWNEPNGKFWLDDTSKSAMLSRYRSMVAESVAALHPSGDKVVAGGLTPVGWFNEANLNRYTPIQFLKDFLSVSSSAVPDFDVWGVHPYTLGGPTKQSPTLRQDPSYGNSIWMGDLPKAAGILNSAKRAGKIPSSTQYWIDEFSWDSSPPDNQICINPANGDRWGATPMNILTRWTAEADYRAWKAGFSALIWHQIKDNPSPGPNRPYQGGLFFAGSNGSVGSEKSATRAFRFPFVAFKRTGGVYVWGIRPWGTSGDVVIQRKTRSGWKSVKTLSTNANGIFSKRFSLSITKSGTLRAKTSTRASAGFALTAPKLRRHIFPFGCQHQ